MTHTSEYTPLKRFKCAMFETGLTEFEVKVLRARDDNLMSQVEIRHSNMHIFAWLYMPIWHRNSSVAMQRPSGIVLKFILKLLAVRQDNLGFCVDSLKASGSYHSACKIMQSHKFWQPQLIIFLCANYVLLNIILY